MLIESIKLYKFEGAGDYYRTTLDHGTPDYVSVCGQELHNYFEFEGDEIEIWLSFGKYEDSIELDWTEDGYFTVNGEIKAMIDGTLQRILRFTGGKEMKVYAHLSYWSEEHEACIVAELTRKAVREWS